MSPRADPVSAPETDEALFLRAARPPPGLHFKTLLRVAVELSDLPKVSPSDLSPDSRVPLTTPFLGDSRSTHCWVRRRSRSSRKSRLTFPSRPNVIGWHSFFRHLLQRPRMSRRLHHLPPSRVHSLQVPRASHHLASIPLTKPEGIGLPPTAVCARRARPPSSSADDVHFDRVEEAGGGGAVSGGVGEWSDGAGWVVPGELEESGEEDELRVVGEVGEQGTVSKVRVDSAERKSRAADQTCAVSRILVYRVRHKRSKR